MKRAICTILLAALALGFAATPAAPAREGARTILLLEPRSSPPSLRQDAFRREFSRDALRTSKLRLAVMPVDHLDEKRLALQVDEALATDPALIVAPASRIALFVAARNRAIPTLFVSVASPSLIGLLSDPARPGANLTGLTYAALEQGKFFEIARELSGKGARVGLLVDRYWLTLPAMRAALETARRELGIETIVFAADSAAEARAEIAKERGRIDVWILPDTPLGRYHGHDLVLWLRARGGVVVVEREDLLDSGGHVLVKPVIENPMEILAEMADLILGGVPLARIPVARPKEFSVILNMPQIEKTPGPAWRNLIAVASGYRRDPRPQRR